VADYPKGQTALAITDATNDFISEGGKAWSPLNEVCESVGTVPNMKRVLAAARTTGLHVMYAPMETQPWDYGAWNPTPTQGQMYDVQLFKAGQLGRGVPSRFRAGRGRRGRDPAQDVRPTTRD
jgi:nicotinamidase-related amidase